jgi:anti-sigma factor RsiW
MNLSETAGEMHIGEGDLIRYLDGEMTAGERAEVATHLLRCGQCNGALDELRTDREQFSELLAEVTVPALDPARRDAAWSNIERAAAVAEPARRTSRVSFLRAAGIAALLAGSALTVSPVRAAVADLWNAVFDRVETAAVRSAPMPQREVVSVANATIGFVPAGEVFRIEIANLQVEGSLLLGVSTGRSVTARAVGGDEIVDLIILPDGMRIENGADDTTDYAVNLPAHLEQLQVRIGNDREIVYEMDQLAGSWISVVDLTANAYDLAPAP